MNLRTLALTAAAAVAVAAGGLSTAAALSGSGGPGTSAGALPDGASSAGPALPPGLPAGPPGSRPTAQQLAQAAADQAPTAQVTLITGDKLDYTRLGDGRQIATLVSGPGQRHGGLLQFTWQGDLYAIPAEAIPYLPTKLDARLFDVSYLIRSGDSDAADSSIPLAVQWAHERAAQVPGISAAPPAGAAAHVSLRKDQARLWGQAMAAPSNGRATGFLAHITRVSFASPGGPGGAPPAAAAAHAATGPMETLRTAWDPAKWQFTIVLVQNVDNLQSYTNWNVYLGSDGGEAFSVPAGTYSIIAVLIHEEPNSPKLVLDTVPEINVTRPRNVSLSAAGAKPLTVSLTGGPATQEHFTGFDVSRTSVTGGALNVDWNICVKPAAGCVSLYAVPAASPAKGRLDFQAGFWLTSTPSSGPPDNYDLVFPDTSGISNPQYTVSDAQLARVRESLYAPSAPAGYDAVRLYAFAATSWGDLTPVAQPDVTAPSSFTNYFYDASGTDVWKEQLLVDVGLFGGLVLDGPYRSFAKAGTYSERWLQGPLGPAIERETVAQPPQLNAWGLWAPYFPCPACRQDNNLSLRIYPFGDSDPGHWPGSAGVPQGQWATTKSTVTLAQNGQIIDIRHLPEGMFPLLGSPAARYTLTWDFQGGSPFTEPGAETHTVWTFSAPSAASKLPPFEECLPDPTVRCSFVPLLFAHYHLDTNLTDQAPAGHKFTISFTVSHQLNEPGSAVASASLAVSYDGGKTWQPVSGLRSLGHGSYSAQITQPPLPSTDGYVSLRVRATDTHGNSVAQTSIHAYALTG